MFDVLLLDAGGIPSPLQSIPALTNPLLGQRNLDWQYVTTPQKYSCFGMINQVHKLTISLNIHAEIEAENYEITASEMATWEVYWWNE